MTINKKAILFSALAASMLASSAVAGTLTADANTSIVASELVVGQDFNGTSVGLASTYVPNLNAGVQDGKLLIEFDGGRIPAGTLPGGLQVYNITQGKVVGINPSLAGANSQKLVFDINDSINDHDKLGLDDGSSADHNVTALTLDILKGKNAVTMQYHLLDNTDTPKDDSTAATVMKTEQEWTVKINQPFDGRIDASAEFKKFMWGATQDQAELVMEQNPKVVVSSGNLNLNVQTFMDQNISAFGTLVSSESGPAALTLKADTTMGYKVDENTTATAGAAANAYSYTFTADTQHKIEDTNFKVSVAGLSTELNPQFKTTYLNQADFGNWAVNGYYAKIPNVAATESVDVTLKFTNRSQVDSEIFFTLIDKNGVVANVSSTNASIAKLNAGTTGTYKASQLLGLVSNPSFDKASSFSVEVSIPVSPDAVYGMASFKNKVLGQFKDLPVYNNSQNFSY